MGADKQEIIYYEMVKMEDRLNEKSEEIFKAEKKITSALERFEILYNQLIKKIEAKI